MTKFDILKAMSNAANSYFSAYVRCMEQRIIDSKTFQWLPIPAITCIALSCEIYLKVLLLCFDTSYPDGFKNDDLKKLFGSVTKAHDLEKLFKLLSEEVRDNIKSSYKNSSEFDKELSNIKAYFATSRYLYEKEKANFNFPFIEWFNQKLKELVDNQLT